MKLFDTHSHYDDSRFDGEEVGCGRYELISELFGSNVGLILGAGVDIPTSTFQVRTSGMFEGFYAAVGVHPENCGQYNNIEETLAVIEELAKQPKSVAIGEIGLDFYWEQNPPREVQQSWFDAQLSLAEKLKKPVIIHDREAHGACFDTVLRHPGVVGVFHSYSGSSEMARELVKRGWYISFSGVVTYKNATRLADVVASIPEERILIETDCPYLSPVPMRGKINRSDYTEYTAAKIASILGREKEEVAAFTLENGKRLFGIS